MGKSLFKVNDWQEEFTIEEKIAHARAVYDIEGELTGKINVDYTILYLNYNKENSHQSSSVFEGFMIFDGEMNGRKGRFILRDKGSFIDNQYEAKVEVITGTGTGDFIGISGKGTYEPAEEGMLLNLMIN
ncbi:MULTISPECIES: DUF3224 domain-containing protein [Vagococcus]|uniref:DUF3224 domain-containing protein n=1 Tax=Vagococcus fluvialis bH819 TaxID=1255619 RepID=A0A1X6WQS7_9ENTE|nr:MULTISPECIES: DUF3224 domain-containing protein [Vagococcus]SLM86592.1 hypothetical protein FM121_10895 [Vagococcus fluvialis bH819]HCM90800.1 DUF3224 domain-containing protein [Vagococcus sp.]